MLASDLAMDVEPPTRTGASAQAAATAHDRVCSCHPRAGQTDCHAPSLISACLGKQFASPERTFLSSLMGRCAFQQGLRSLPRSGEERADGSLRVVYAAGIRRCRPCALRQQCQWQDSARAVPRQVSVRLAPSCRWFGSAPLVLLPPKRISARLYAARATPTHRSEPSASCCRFARHCKRDPVPHAASACSSLLARAAGSQCSRFNNRASDD